MGLDIGPESITQFSKAILNSKTIIWNGPMGVSEWEPFSKGTHKIANVLSGLSDAKTVIGGGSTAEIVASLGLSDRMTHVSTGGGATLKFLEGKILPSISCLSNKT